MQAKELCAAAGARGVGEASRWHARALVRPACPAIAMSAALLVAAAFAALFIWAVARRLLFTRAFRFPGPCAYPLLGNCTLLLGTPSDFFRLCHELGSRHRGGVFRLWIGMRPFVFLYDSAVIKPLVTSSIHLEKNFEYSLSEDWLGRGLITSKGDLWYSQRKLLTSCFHFNILREFSGPVWRHTRVLLDKMAAASAGGRPLDVMPLAKLLALDIICETAMGIDIGTQANSDSQYPAAISRMTEILSHRFITPWLKPKALFNLSSVGREYNKLLAQVQAFVKQIIAKRKKEFFENLTLSDSDNNVAHTTEHIARDGVQSEDKSAGSELGGGVCADCSRPLRQRHARRRLALLDCLLQISREDPSVTDQMITDQVNTFMFAGHDTIASVVAFTLYALGHHPHWQDAVVDEVDGELPQLMAEEPESRAALKGLSLLERCVKEAMRLYPAAPMVGRTINSPLETPGGTLPAGTTAIVYTFQLHRDAAVFPRPDEFDPDRWLPERAPHDPFAYLPFSAGPRNCIGKTLAMLELKLILAMVVKTYKVRSLQAVHQLNLSFEIVLTNPDGIILQLSPRV